MNLYKLDCTFSLKSLRSEAIQRLVQISYEDDEKVDSNEVSILETTKSQLTTSLFNKDKKNQKDFSLLNSFPLSYSELEIIFGLCDSLPTTASQGRSLINDVIQPYFTNCDKQLFSDHVMNKFHPSKITCKDELANEGSSVYEILSFKLAKFLISCHGKFVELRSSIDAIFASFFNSLNSKFVTNDVFVVLGIFNAASKTSYASNIQEKLVISGWKFLDLYDSKLKIIVENDVGNELLSSYYEYHCEIGPISFLDQILKLQYSIIDALFKDEKNFGNSFIEFMLFLKRQKEVQPTVGDPKYETITAVFEKNQEFLKYVVFQSLNKLKSLQKAHLDVTSLLSLTKIFQIQDILLQSSCLTLFYYNEQNVITIVEILKSFLQNYTIETFLPYKEYLASVISFASLLNYYTEDITSELVSFFPVLISNKFVTVDLVKRISKNFSNGLPALTEDTVVGSIYDISNLLGERREKYLQKRKMTLTSSFGDVPDLARKSPTVLTPFQSMNVLGKLVKNKADNSAASKNSVADLQSSFASLNELDNQQSLSVDAEYEEEYSQLEKAVVSLVTISSNFRDNSISVLILTILIQKYSSISVALDKIILKHLHTLALVMEKTEFSLIVKFLQSIDNRVDSFEKKNSLIESKLQIARALRDSDDYGQSVYIDYLTFLLEAISTIGSEKNHKKGNSNDDDVNIGLLNQYLLVLSEMLPKSPKNIFNGNEHVTSLLRDLWVNLSTHGFYYDNKSKAVVNCNTNIEPLDSDILTVIALNTPALAAYNPRNTSETSYKLNNILHRKVSSKMVEIQEKSMKKDFGLSGSLSKVEILFITAVTMLESQRLIIAPDIAIPTALLYQSDESVKNDFGNFFENLAKKMCHIICSSTQFRNVLPIERYSSILNSLILLVCSRDNDVQKSAYSVADKLIGYLPELLNIKKSIFLCLDLLSTLYQSVCDVMKNKYELFVNYQVDPEHNVSLPLSEHWRKDTLKYFEQHCSSWLDILILRTPDSTKSILYQYVSTKSRENYVKLTKFNYGVSFANNKANSLNGSETDPETYINQKIDHSLRSSNNAWASLDSTIEFFTASSLSQQSQNSLLWVQYHDLKRQLFDSSSVLNEFDIKNETVPLFLNICSKILYINLENGVNENTGSLLADMINVSFFKGTGSDNLNYGVTVWKKMISHYPELSGLFLTELVKIWELHVSLPIFILNTDNGVVSCEDDIMEYTPSDTKSVIEKSRKLLEETSGYLQLFKFVEEMGIKTLQFNENSILSDMFVQFMKVSLDAFNSKTNVNIHPSLKYLKLRLFKTFYKLIECCFKRITKSSTETLFTSKNLSGLLRDVTINSLRLFAGKCIWPFGNDSLEWDELYYSIKQISKIISTGRSNNHSAWFRFLHTTCGDELKVLTMFLAHELHTISVWQEPCGSSQFNSSSASLSKLDEIFVKKCFAIDISLTANLIERYLGQGGIGSVLNKERASIMNLFATLVNTEPVRTAKYYNYGLKLLTETNFIKYGTLFGRIDPMSTVNYLLPVSEYSKFIKSPKTLPIILQYFMKSLESHTSQVTFFYIPQIVQCLRYDNNGYVERFILDSGMINSYFAHQIIWNMKANKYNDENLVEIDPVLGPKLYTITEKIEKSFDKDALDFYYKEFTFFTEVTAISGTLKDYIKYSKPEKKHVIDQEMAKIKVLPGVYLPSNPDGIVVDIERKSGKPLQSHAKAPFMATFKIEKVNPEGNPITKLQSAIFKVGDDCRQDVLALQLINCCKNIWLEIGLDVYVFPYRVTATDGGCGVIDVLPNSISRDMLGREAVNGLYEWFVSKFGHENSTTFEAARLNFIKSLAGYSVISYLLQFKDRHNGNIMYDDFGHILHIDFGFIFDIVPGGVKFEAVPFKLTKEMIRVLGGSKDSLGFKLFEQLTIKAFLSLRKHFKFIQNTIEPMLDSNLPCFKGKTIKHLRNRMALDRNEEEAAHFMKGKISRSYESSFTKGYDEFQRLTNGIPY